MNELEPAETRTEFVTGAWARTVLQPLAMALLTMALFVGAVAVVDQIAPGSWFSFGPLCFFMALEAIYTTLWLQHPDRRLVDRTRYRAAELLLLAVATRLVVWGVRDAGFPTLADWRLFLGDPVLLIADGTFVVLLILLVILWTHTTRMASLFAQLAISETEARYYSQPRRYQETWADDKPIEVQRPWLVELVLKQWLWGGVVLLICTGLSSVDLPELGRLTNPFAVSRLGLRPELLAGLISYFLAGFWLLSQARLEMMNARWLINGVRKHDGVERRWQRGSLLVLLVVALLAAFLPIGSTLPIGRLLDLVVGTVLYVSNLIFYVLTFLFTLLLSLLAGSGQAETEPAEPPPSFEEVLAQRQPPELPPATPDNTLTLLISSLFWAVLVFVLISALLFFLRERGVTFNRGALRRAWQLWVAWLRTLWQGFETQVVELRQSLRLPRRAREEAEETAVSPWRFVRVNALSPREQIRYFYLSVVRRAGDKGVMRGPSETPLEYIQDLTSEWPEEADDISQLTDAFLEARYAARPIEKTRADAVKGTWKQVKASIRGRRREEDES